MKRLLLTSTVLMFLSSVFAGNALALQQFTTNFTMPTQLQGSITASDCQNAPGPQITFEGALALDGLGAQLIFRNNEKGTHTHTEEFKANSTLLKPGDTIVIPKQPSQGGVGGNPFIWVQILNTNGQAVTGEIFLGRCVQGAWKVSPNLTIPVTAAARIAVEDCTNNPGPFITLEGDMSFFPGLVARFIFRNNDNPVGGPHEASAIRDMTILPAGKTIQFPKQPVLGGVGGNPWISFLFLNGRNEPIGTEYLLGRCVQLLPGN
jgi:hypothetical protein